VFRVWCRTVRKGRVLRLILRRFFAVVSLPKTPSGECTTGDGSSRFGWRGRQWPHRSR